MALTTETATAGEAEAEVERLSHIIHQMEREQISLCETGREFLDNLKKAVGLLQECLSVIPTSEVASNKLRSRVRAFTNAHG